MKKINKNNLNPSLTLPLKRAGKIKIGTSKQQGFTLIELIVSVTIIAVLTIVGTVSFSGTNKSARDSRRMADLENIRIALELYRQGTGSSYPADIDQVKAYLIPTYIKEVPKDPKKYEYTYISTGLAYNLCAQVEDVGSTNTINGDVCGFNIGDVGFVGFYKVTNP